MPAWKQPLDSEAVSEVLGSILAFGIISVLVVVAVSQFQEVADDTRLDAAEAQAESIATLLAGRYADMASWVEEDGGPGASYHVEIGLPNDLEGHSYTVDLQSGSPPSLSVRVQGDEVATRSLAAASITDHVVCDATVTGPRVDVRYVDGDPNAGPPFDCAAALALYPNSLILLENT